MGYKWTHVTDGLPNINEEIIAYYGGKFVGNAWIDNNSNWITIQGPAEPHFPVTHWCHYLPKEKAFSIMLHHPGHYRNVICYIGNNTKTVLRINNHNHWETPDGKTEYIHLPVHRWAEIPEPPISFLVKE